MVSIGFSPTERVGTRLTTIRSPYTWYTEKALAEQARARSYAEFTNIQKTADNSYVGNSYEDIMEYFAAHSLLGSDGDEYLPGIYYSDVLGFATLKEETRPPAEYANQLRKELGFLSPQVLQMTQTEFEDLLTFEEVYSSTGVLSWRATLEIPVPDGYRTIQVRLSEVV